MKKGEKFLFRFNNPDWEQYNNTIVTYLESEPNGGALIELFDGVICHAWKRNLYRIEQYKEKTIPEEMF